MFNIETLKYRRYDNACTNCKFLGRFNEFDLYFCNSGIPGFFIARGPNGETTGGRETVRRLNTPELNEAVRRSVEFGYCELENEDGDALRRLGDSHGS